MFRSGPPRRKPFPYDLVFGSTGLMLGKKSKSQVGLVSSKMPDMDVAQPSDFSYGSMHPKYERIQTHERMPRGMGKTTQEGFEIDAYWYAVGADLSVYPWLVGPEITSVTPTTTGSISHFFELNSTVYAVAGRYILKRTGDAGADWTVSKDFNDYGSGTTVTDVVTFYSPALSETRAWIALSPSTENFVDFDGSSYSQESGTNMDALAWAVVGRELWRFRDTNLATKCDTNANPTSVDNWLSPDQYRVGDKSSAVTRATTLTNGRLIVFKTDGCYTLDDAGEEQPLFSSLDIAPHEDNGKGYGPFLNEVYVPFKQGLYKIGPEPSIALAGPELQDEGSDSPVRGRITAFLGHDSHRAYAGIYNGTNSYIVVMNPDGTWHGSISQVFSSKYATAMFKSTVGASTGSSRLYIGFSDGSISFIQLPNDPYPAADTNYRFSTSAGEVYFSRFTGGYEVDNKHIRSVTIAGHNLTGANFCQLDYKTSLIDSSFTDLGSIFDTTPMEKVEFPSGTRSKVGLFKLKMTAVNHTQSPQVSGMAIHFTRRPPLIRVHQFSVLAEDGLLRRDGAPLRIGADRIRYVISDAAQSNGQVSCSLPTEDVKNLVVVDYGESIAWSDRTKRWHASIDVEAGEIGLDTLPSTYGALEGYTYSLLEGLSTYGEIEVAAVR